jgi:hypothetical protein
MLGELVAKEVLAIEHEKECHCPGCAVNGSIRIINIYMAKNTCECPVCTMTRGMLYEQADKLRNILKSHTGLEDEIGSATSTVVYVPPSPEMQEKVKLFISQQGAILALAMALRGSVQRFLALCGAAHAAYDVVQEDIARAKIVLFTGRNQPHERHTLDDLIGKPPDSNHNVN